MDADLLARCGFLDVGDWALDGDAVRFVPSTELGDATQAVYAFALGRRARAGGVVAYVGVTDGTLAARLSGYENPGPTQSTNIRLGAAIREQLAMGVAVAVLAAWPGERTWCALPVQLHRGLEAGLIDLAKPEWNR